MFEISWSELLILAVVTLIFVGPKDMPVFFNTLGRYMGAIRRQANEFRRHFEDAMREAEFERINEEVRQLGDEMTGAMREVVDSTNAATKPAPLQEGTAAPPLEKPTETAAADGGDAPKSGA